MPICQKNLGKPVYEDYALCLDVMLFCGGKKKRKEEKNSLESVFKNAV